MQNPTPLRSENTAASFRRSAVSVKGMALLGIILLSSACASTMSSSHEKTNSTQDRLNSVVAHSVSHNEPTLISQRISGKVLDDDGKTALAGATIYIANDKLDSTQKAGKKMIADLSLSELPTTSLPCARPVESYSAFACSQGDGSFELTIPQISQLPLSLTFVKGDKKVNVDIDLNDLGTNIGIVAFDFPEPQRNNVAIVLDLFNPYDDIRNQLKTRQLSADTVFLDLTKQLSEVFDISDPNSDVTFPDLQSLFEDTDNDGKIDIFNYDVVYLNSRNESDIAKLDKVKKQVLLQYISRGGQLYVTEWTIELPEIPLDQYI